MTTTTLRSQRLARTFRFAKKPLALLPLGALLLSGSIAQAQSEENEAVLRAVKVTERIEADSKTYKAATSTAATKTATPLRDVPQSASVITSKAIKDLSMQNLADVVRYVPGVGMAQGEGNRETPVFRGSSSTSDFFIDGIRDDVQYYRDLYNIDRVEVLKGPNGMIFGRGGAGGVINRVTKEAGWNSVREITLQGGSDSNKRVSVDVGGGLNDTVAGRINAVYEDSDSYRDDVSLERQGINPTLTINAGENTRIDLAYEYFKDERTADRGVSSFAGKPLDTDPSTFFGDPDRSPVRASVNAFSALVEHEFNEHVSLRNRTRYADYDKFYQNVYPGAVDASATNVTIQAYNNATERKNLFNQTDLLFAVKTGTINHQFATGLELGRQVTDNFRESGFFGATGTATSASVPVANPRYAGSLVFRQNATDADNHGVSEVVGAYVQDQIEFTPQFLAVLGLRYDHFAVDFDNHRTSTEINTDDNLISPRVGLIYKPVEPVSLYASYSLSSVPRAGEQLASLTLTNAALDPEEFENREIGAKWEVTPDLALAAAIFQLKRSNVAITDPNNSARQILLSGDAQEVNGLELTLTGNITPVWSVIGAYAYQDGELTQTQTTALQKGSTLASLPEHSASLWNKYEFSTTWGAGVGVIYRDDMLAATENKASPASNVTLDGYTRVDAALFFKLNPNLRAQLNVENVFDKEYSLFANSNTNITPGSPRAFRVSVTASY